MSATALNGLEADRYFETLGDDRRQLFFLRCERLLGGSFEDTDDIDEANNVFSRVLTDMWCADLLERLVSMGRLEVSVDTDGRRVYSTAVS